MGCGCGKGGSRRRRTIAPSINSLAVRNSGAPPTTAEVRALGLQQSVSINETRRLDDQKRLIERKRRDAIRRRLGK